MNKKAVDLTINTVVIALLAVLVLVVLFYVFTGKVGLFTKQTNVCPGDCLTISECNQYGGTKLPGNTYIQRDTDRLCNAYIPDGICCSALKP